MGKGYGKGPPVVTEGLGELVFGECVVESGKGGGGASYLGREMWSRSLPYQGVLPKPGLGGGGVRIGRAQSSTALSGSAGSELEFLL